jgi:hypothetical protein
MGARFLWNWSHLHLGGNTEFVARVREGDFDRSRCIEVYGALRHRERLLRCHESLKAVPRPTFASAGGVVATR